MRLSSTQLEVVEAPLDNTIFLNGPAGSGKTTAGTERLNHFLNEGIPGRSILLYFPQRNLGAPYQKTINNYAAGSISLPVFATYGGLARRILSLFWPSVLKAFPRLQTDLPPTFLTLESSQYLLSKVIEPLIESEGYFSAVVIQRNRLYSQILDNLNKSAVHAFPHEEISERLITSWIGDPAQVAIFQQAQVAANSFREYCYHNNLLDYSLQIELFTKALDQIPLVEKYLKDQFDYLIYDNCEEDIPVSHNFIRKLAPHLKSYLIIYDQDAGYRKFLGASPDNALDLSNLCSETIATESIFSASPTLLELNAGLTKMIHRELPASQASPETLKSAISITYHPSYPELADWIAEKIQSLIEKGTSPGEIVILAPYLSDSLRFLISQSLTKLGIPSTSHRPSRALRDEPVAQALLTLASLAHPGWDIHPTTYELALAFVQTIKDLDLTRAYLLANQSRKNNPSAIVQLADFDRFPPNFQERISFFTGNLYQHMLDWLNSYAANPPLPLDHFLINLFGEILSIQGYGFYNDLTKGRIASQIIESISKFRQSVGKVFDFDHLQTGREYYRMVKTGVLANQYIKSWTELPENEVLISPAYTFLLNNKPTDYQFWLDIGSRGWYERIYQPLTNPHIMQRDWPLDKQWTDEEEQFYNLDSLRCLTTGLILRCRKSIYGCLTETDERGVEQKGFLLMSLNRLLLGSQIEPRILENSTND